MTYKEISEYLTGIIPFIPTPFKKADSGATALDEEGLRVNLRFLLDYSFSCVVPTAGTGDLMSLTDEEYKRVLSVCHEEVGDRFLLMPGLPQETERAIEMARYAVGLGIKCLLSFPAPSLGLSEAGLTAHWKAVAAAADIAIVIFRPPWIQYSTAVLDALNGCENIIAIKEESNDLLWFKNAIRKYGERYRFIGGGELLFLHYLLEGAKGITTGLPNFMPEPFFKIYEASRRGEYLQAQEILAGIHDLITLRQITGNAIPVLKYAMELTGLVGGVNRLPQMDLNEETKAKVRTLLKTTGIMKGAAQ